jgi:hypothetical protein
MPFDYPYAGIRAPRPVQMAIAAFRKVPAAMRKDVVLLYWLLGGGTQGYKMSKEEANYSLRPVRGQKCGSCRFAYKNMAHGYIICSHVQGDILPEHWCRLWQPPGTPMDAFPPGQSLAEWTKR